MLGLLSANSTCMENWRAVTDMGLRLPVRPAQVSHGAWCSSPPGHRPPSASPSAVGSKGRDVEQAAFHPDITREVTWEEKRLAGIYWSKKENH